MSGITTALIKELREKTGAGMMDCKKALNETNGNLEEAVDWLRKKGLSAAAKKSGRVAAEGLVAIATKGNKGVIIELNSETDFVAKNDKFQALASGIANVALEGNGDVEELKKQDYPGTGRIVEDEVKELVGVIGENIQLRRAAALESNGIIVSYIHNKVTEDLGKIAILVALESDGDQTKLEELGKQIAMHVAAAKPEALNIEDLDPALVERERNVFAEQAKASGKPDNIIEKMVEGRVRKYYGEVVLHEQVFVIDGKISVREAIANAEKEVGAPIKLTGYQRLSLGEGVEKQDSDFAAEVKAAASGN